MLVRLIADKLCTSVVGFYRMEFTGVTLSDSYVELQISSTAMHVTHVTCCGLSTLDADTALLAIHKPTFIF